MAKRFAGRSVEMEDIVQIGSIGLLKEELIPEMSAGEHSNIGTIFFAVGFSLMMILDVALG